MQHLAAGSITQSVNTNTLRNSPPAPWFPRPLQAPQRAHLVTRLYAQHAAAVIAFARQRGGVQQADAEDVCSVVFEIAFRRLESFRGDASPRTWLLGIARRVLADRRRCASARHEAPVDAVPEQAAEASLEDELIDLDLRQTVAACIRGLPAPQREALTGYVLEERPMAEVARRADVPLQTAYARLYAGQRQLSAQLRAVA
ncbi:MAG: sigma-70 family RNA polymerase sigma factor [Myxococcaceae bacterium]|jgi:RNA polymerase sigma-70 factor (ECF subfamily)|nr:sigma-70 family RNA polymerase sigma factor [Myxococcaceae bacterium]MCA3014492.1 sigma-70 family RNA polymerase sigma factor [Myxococcaceae bacterium]